MSVGQRVKERRKALGLTQEELAKRLGNSSRASICTVEKDREDLTTTRIAKLANALETSPAYLMEWTDDPDPNYDESSLHSPSIPDTMVDYVGNGFIIETNQSKNDKFLNSLRDEEKEFIVRLYQDYLNADQSHRLAVEALLKEKRQES